MKSFSKIFKTATFILTAIFAGISLFMIITASDIKNTVLSNQLHKNMFNKYDIYTEAQTVINSSIKDYMSNLKKSYPDAAQQNEDIFSMLEDSVTPDMIKTNIDSLRDGIFQYINNERKFLPDIYLNNGKPKTQSASLKEETENSPIQAFAKIEKINLSAILLYINRSDISDALFQLKFLNYAISVIPGYLSLFLLLAIIIGLFIDLKPSSFSKWVTIFASTCGVLLLISSLLLYYYSKFVLPKSIYPIVISVPLKANVILSYLQGCIFSVALPQFVLGVCIGLSAFAALFLTLPALKKLSKNVNITHDVVNKTNTHKTVLKIVFSSLCLLIVSLIFYKTSIVKSVYEKNDFSLAISKMMNVNTVTEVISAKDEAVYTLEVKLVDKKSGDPVPNVSINVAGQSSITGNNYNQTLLTNDTGSARYTLDKGNFRISFDPDTLSENYQIPAAFFSELKSAGTTIITVNLEEPREIDINDWGIVEVEILDKDNNPMPNIQLTVDGIISAPGYPNDIFSYTNSEGIAVFKTGAGSYKIKCVEDDFPEQYELPQPIEVILKPNSVTRYTIRLVNVKNQE